MRKSRLIIVLLILVLFLFGCTQNKSSNEVEPIEKVPEDTEQEATSEDDNESDKKINISTSTGAAYSNDKIPSEIKEEVDNLNNEFIEHVIKNDADYVESHIYNQELQTHEDIVEVVKLYSDIIREDIQYSILGQYYFVVDANGNSSRSMTVSDDGEYIVSTTAMTGEIFISFIIIESVDKDTLLTLEFVREDTDWQIRALYLNDYSYFDMNALDFYEKAQICADNNRPLSAFFVYVHLCLYY